MKLQVDFAPTFLSLAGIEMPDYMDGTDLVPLLVAPAVARAQGEALPGSVTRSLSRSQVGGAVPKPKPVRETSFHQYFNQGPWKVNCTQAPKHPSTAQDTECSAVWVESTDLYVHVSLS